MARAAKSPARARPKGYAAPTNGKATKKSSAARTSTKFLLVALVVLYATPSSLLLLSNPLLFFAIGAHNFMGILNFYYTCEPVNSVCAKVHDRLMTFLIEQSKVPPLQLVPRDRRRLLPQGRLQRARPHQVPRGQQDLRDRGRAALLHADQRRRPAGRHDGRRVQGQVCERGLRRVA